MGKYKIAVSVGSLRKDSFNKKLADAVIKLAPPDLAFRHVQISNLPLYNQDDDSNQADPVKLLKSEIRDSHGVLFVTPEYNRSIPGVLKNAIDHCSRPYGQNVWAGKPAGIIGISIGPGGTAMSQQHLRNVLAYLDMPTLCQPEVFLQVREGLFDDAGNIGTDRRQLLQGWMERYAEWVELHQQK